ncbi:MAG: PTS fructose transporter subunit IIA [Gammaproteobacteria bacterium]|nr:PTS fructose transporter subunit IIA [Gammaproteobacteria bacterium]
MTVAVLLITHDDVGMALLEAVTSTLGMCPLNAVAIGVKQSDEPQDVLKIARNLIDEVDGGSGVLVLTDMYGSTPSNIANLLLDDVRVKTIAGLNLPMLIRLFNYSHLTRDELLNKVVEGGREGVLSWQRDV